MVHFIKTHGPKQKYIKLNSFLGNQFDNADKNVVYIKLNISFHFKSFMISITMDFIFVIELQFFDFCKRAAHKEIYFMVHILLHLIELKLSKCRAAINWIYFASCAQQNEPPSRLRCLLHFAPHTARRSAWIDWPISVFFTFQSARRGYLFIYSFNGVLLQKHFMVDLKWNKTRIIGCRSVCSIVRFYLHITTTSILT